MGKVMIQCAALTVIGYVVIASIGVDDSTGFLFMGLLIGCEICGAAGYLILERVRRGVSGFLLGFLLGPIGLVMAWVIRDNALRDK